MNEHIAAVAFFTSSSSAKTKHALLPLGTGVLRVGPGLYQQRAKYTGWWNST